MSSKSSMSTSNPGSSSSSSETKRRKKAFDVMISLAAQEKYPNLEITNAVRNLAVAVPAVYRTTKKLRSSDPLSRNLAKIARPTLIRNGLSDNTQKIAWSADGTRLASEGDNGSLNIWDAATGERIGNIKPQFSDQFPNLLGWLPNGRIVTDTTNSITVVDVEAALQKRSIPSSSQSQSQRRRGIFTRTAIPEFIDDDYAMNMMMSADGSLIANYSDTGIRVGKIAPDGKAIGFKLFDKTSLFISIMAFNPAGTLLAAMADRILYVWDIETGKFANLPLVTPFKNSYRPSIDWSPDGTLLVLAKMDRVALFDMTTSPAAPRLIYTSDKYDDTFKSVAWSPDGKTIAAGTKGASETGHVYTWRVLRNRELGARKLLDTFDSPVECIAWGPDGSLAANTGDEMRIWNRYRFAKS